MTEPRGQELINRYRWNYGIPTDAPLTEEMILAHWKLEQHLTRELLESTPENRWETFERCYSTLYGELEWLNRLTDQAATTPPAQRYQSWSDLIGKPPKDIYEIGSGKAAMIGFLAGLGHRCTATEITRERGAKHAVEHENLRWTLTDGVHLGEFEPPASFDFVLSDNVIEHLHPDDLMKHLADARGILRPGGQYIFAVPHRWYGPWNISKVFKYEIATGMHLKEYTHRELRNAALEAGFRRVAAVRLPPDDDSGHASEDAGLLQRICLLKQAFSLLARPIFKNRAAAIAKQLGIAPLAFLVATK